MRKKCFFNELQLKMDKMYSYHGKEKLLPSKQVFHLSGLPVKYGNGIL